MRLGVLKSLNTPLVPLTPTIVAKYLKENYEIILESGAGVNSFFDDQLYLEAGAKIAPRLQVISESDVILVDTEIATNELSQLKTGVILIGRFGFRSNPKYAVELLQSSAMVFSLDLVPRSSIAQSMDVLSSLASLAGYKAALGAAVRFSGYFPMMTTAAGTVPPAKVLVLGAGVAGLQAIATAKRLGASVEAFDVRHSVKEEVQSLGAKFIEVEGSSDDLSAGGYAVAQSEAYIEKQKVLIHQKASKADVVITTANIPGRKAPLLIEKQTVEAMQPGSVIIDLASATGGNCALTEDNKEIVHNSVTILGDAHLYHKLPKEASRLYSNNIYNFIKFILKDGVEAIPHDHEIVQQTLLTKDQIEKLHL